MQAIDNLWHNGLSAQGCRVATYELTRAFAQWRPEHGYTALAAELARGNSLLRMNHDAALRIADRMLQRARKAGLVHPKKGRRGVWARGPAEQ